LSALFVWSASPQPLPQEGGAIAYIIWFPPSLLGDGGKGDEAKANIYEYNMVQKVYSILIIGGICFYNLM
jgi:hypothetical protein